MKKVSEIFRSHYLKAADLQGRTIKAQIESVALEEIGDLKDEKLVVYFLGKDRGLVLNKTNAALLASRFDDDPDKWIGQAVQLVSEPVNYQGRMVDGLRIKVPTPTAVQDFEDDVPF